jgi:hypothetical protein
MIDDKIYGELDAKKTVDHYQSVPKGRKTVGLKCHCVFVKKQDKLVVFMI